MEVMLMLMQRYEKYLANEQQILISLDSECQESRMFERIYREFEAQKLCYLPINAFLLKPAQRLLHYQLIISSELILCCFVLLWFSRLTLLLYDQWHLMASMQSINHWIIKTADELQPLNAVLTI